MPERTQLPQPNPRCRVLLLAALLLCGCGTGPARLHASPGDAPMAAPAGPPPAVPVGAGSYAAYPPPDADAKARETAFSPPPYVDNPDRRPVPTNHWWTDMIVHPFGGQVWAFPLMAKANDQGVDLFYPVKWNDAGTDPVSDMPVGLRGVDFHPAGARVRTWGDWTVSYREAETPDRFVDVTLGRGLPYCWLEYHNVAPLLTVTGGATLFDAAGKPLSLPFTGDRFGFENAGRNYGVFAPDGTRFHAGAGGLTCDFAGPGHYLVVCALPTRQDLAAFGKYAFAIPRDSRLSWDYDPAKGQVTTHWHLTTDLLKGAEHGLIQGWLPHHYHGTATDLAFNGMQYLTPRGTMRCAPGTDFQISYPFHGFLPFLPAPQAQGGAHDFDPARMRHYLAGYAAKTGYGDDTYWGGKSLTQLGDYLAAARQMQDPSFDALRQSLGTALADWYTYTPGEKAHYFARYPAWQALIGFKTSYGSETFNDNHFHYGYFTRATALMGMMDPPFLHDYGPMARLVAKQYANWDRSDSQFPFLRCFDVWEGHSWASGLSSPTGSNQESSSEAVQSWGGLFLLGTAMGDKDMTAAGAMGYAMESNAALEYWFNAPGTNFAPNYPHPIVGMVWGGGDLYGTYFSDDPAWIWGIQWLPMSPMMSYLVRDPAFARKSFQTMLAERIKKKGDADLHGMGTGLANVVLSEAQQFDPDWAAAQMDALWDANDPIAHDNDTGGMTYYLTHSDRMLGPIQWDYHMSLPTSGVYRSDRTGQTSYVAYNPTATPQTVIVYNSDQPVGQFEVPARTLVRRTDLSATSASASLPSSPPPAARPTAPAARKKAAPKRRHR